MSVVPKLAMLGLAATLSSPRRVQHVAGMRLIVRHIPNEIDCLPPICSRQAARDKTNARGDADGSISHFWNRAVFDA
jgi:hypothetical protein